MQIHPDDWGVWQELVQSVKDGQRPNLSSNKRRRALLAVAKIVDEMQRTNAIKVKE